MPGKTNTACTATVAEGEPSTNAEYNKKDTAGTATVAEDNKKDDDDLEPGNTKWKTKPSDHPAASPESGKPNLDTGLNLNAKRGKLWDQTAGPINNPIPKCQPRNAECNDLDSQSEGEAAGAESVGDEDDTNSEHGNEVEVLDSRLDHDRTQAADGKNDDTDESRTDEHVFC